MSRKKLFNWQLMLAAAFVLLLLIPLLSWNQLNRCSSSGGIRLDMDVHIDNNGQTNITGYLLGIGAGRYRTQGYQIILYSKTDIWYSEPNEVTKIPLANDCSWEIANVNPGDLYAAFLVSETYQPEAAIDRASKDAPLPIDGDKIVAWDLWPDTSELSSDRVNNAENRALSWLAAQMIPNKVVPQPYSQRDGLVLSYRIPPSDSLYDVLVARSWLPDNALTAIAFTAHGHTVKAKTILNALVGQIEADGKIGFSFETDDEWYHDHYRTGAIAWVGYALIYHQQKTGDRQHQQAAEQIADYLLTLQETDATMTGFGSLRESQSAPWSATNDNIVAYFFLRDLGRVTGSTRYAEAAKRVQDSLLKDHWNSMQNRFNQGVEDEEWGLVELHGLGSLFATAMGDSDKATASLLVPDAKFHLATSASATYIPNQDSYSHWSVGSLIVAYAEKRNSNSGKYELLIEEILGWQENGGILYAIPPKEGPVEEGYNQWPSAAATSWLLITLADDPLFWGP